MQIIERAAGHNIAGIMRRVPKFSRAGPRKCEAYPRVEEYKEKRKGVGIKVNMTNLM